LIVAGEREKDFNAEAPSNSGVAVRLLGGLSPGFVCHQVLSHQVLSVTRFCPSPGFVQKLIDDGQRREDVAALLNVDRTTLYQALS
jgi:hypothetical protein